MKEYENLEGALKDLMSIVRKAKSLQQEIDSRFGVRLHISNVPGYATDCSGEIIVRRGIEEIEKALGKEAKIDSYSVSTKFLRYQGIEFRQYADDRTRTFVRAWKEPPQVRIVEDEGEENL